MYPVIIYSHNHMQNKSAYVYTVQIKKLNILQVSTLTAEEQTNFRTAFKMYVRMYTNAKEEMEGNVISITHSPLRISLKP